MRKNYIAVVGATGAVGRQMLLEVERLGLLDRLPLRLFASSRSAGKKMSLGQKEFIVEEFSVEAIKNAYVLMSAGGTFSKQHSPDLVKNGCMIIDNSSAWRMDDSIPLIVPEVNGELLSSYQEQGIIANPNCSTIQMVVSLKPLLDHYGIESVHVVTFQSVSGAGQAGVEDLQNQIKDSTALAAKLPRKIAFDVIPAIDSLQEDGHCFEEIKMVQETRKILGEKNLSVYASTVRVPTYYGHGESITVQLSSRAGSVQEVQDVLERAPGIKLVRSNTYDALPTPVSIGDSPWVHVARVRFPVDEKQSDLLQYWNVANNLLKGAATNAAQILQHLLGNAL